jgi:hypothetical protein
MLLALFKYQLIVKPILVKKYQLVTAYHDNVSLIHTDLDSYVHTLQKQLHVSDQRMENIRTETCKDAHMKTLKDTILNGWPESRAKCDE